MFRAIFLAIGLLFITAGPVAADPLADIRAGNEAFANGKLEKAIADFSRAIESGDLDTETLALAHNNRGVVLAELGDFDRAIDDYERSLELKPGDPKSVRNLRIAYTRRGLAAARLGELDRALADFTRAIELEPSHPTAYVRRAELRLERGTIEAAIEDLEKAVSLAPDNREARSQLNRARAVLAARANAAPVGEGGTTPLSRSASSQPTSQAAAPSAADATAASPAMPGSAAQGAGGVSRGAAPPPTPTEGAPGARFRVKTEVFVRAEPLTASPAIGSLRRGVEFTARGEDKGWFKVELADGRSGWVYQRFVEAVETSGQ